MHSTWSPHPLRLVRPKLCSSLMLCMYAHTYTHTHACRPTLIRSFRPGGGKKSSLLFHMAPKPHRAGLLAWGCWGWWGWRGCCMLLHLPAEVSRVVSEGPGQGCRRAGRETRLMQHFIQGKDLKNTHHPQLQAGTTVQVPAKRHEKTSGPSGQPGRQRGECGPWAGGRRSQDSHQLPSGTCRSRGVVMAGRRSGQRTPVAVHAAGTLDPCKEGIFTVLKSAAYSFLFRIQGTRLDAQRRCCRYPGRTVTPDGQAGAKSLLT